MRYRIGEDMQELGSPVKDGLVGFSVIIGLFIGVIFVIAGIRAKQIWLSFWGAGLVIASILYVTIELPAG